MTYTPQVPFERRREGLDRIDSMTIKPTRFSTSIDVQKAGEVAVDVKFPIVFVERPLTSFGAELGDNHSPEATNFPTVSVVVLRWWKDERPQGTYYVGATIGIVTTGRPDHHMVVHWHAEGKGMRNPAGTMPDTGETL